MAVSCPSSSFCAALDSAGHVLTSMRPTGGRKAWGAALIDPAGYEGPGGPGIAGLQALSCPSRSLCVALDWGGIMFTSRRPTGGASAWHRGRVSGTYAPGAISCASAALCVSIQQFGFSGDAIVSGRPAGGASAWRSKSIQTGGINSLTAISCPSVSLCIAGDSLGRLISSTRPAGGSSAWRSPVDLGSRGPISAVSCPLDSFCVVLGGYAYAPVVLTSHRPGGGAGAWMPTAAPSGLRGLSCPTMSLCVAFSYDQILTSGNPAGGASAWTTRYTEPPSTYGPCEYHVGCLRAITALSCASPTLCVAVNGKGDVLSSTDPTGGAGAWNIQFAVGGPSFGGTGVSCPSTLLCVMSGGQSILTSTSPATGPWSISPSPQGGAPSVFPGSCPTAGLCVGVRGPDLVLSANPAGGPWTTAYTDQFPPGLHLPGPYGIEESPAITGVSCPSASLCVAIDMLANVIIGT